jgi:hypothetical protein
LIKVESDVYSIGRRACDPIGHVFSPRNSARLTASDARGG